jgi:AcrR family transcriptional regulator
MGAMDRGGTGTKPKRSGSDRSPAGGGRGRLGREERREALLDAAAALAAEGEPEAITMDAVAERAGVSRPLVYRHFPNREELIAAVHRRETAHLHDQLAADVAAAGDLEGMFRTLIHGALQAAAERGHLFATLRSAGALSPEVRREQRQRDAATARAFAECAWRELGVDEPTAQSTMYLLLSLVDPALSRWRRDATPQHAAQIETSFMTIVSSTLGTLADAQLS